VLGDPPRGVEVVERVSFEECLARNPDLVGGVLREGGISAREVVFNTGDTDEDPLAFLYADLDAQVAAYVRVRPLDPSSAEAGDPIVPITRSVLHLVESHTIGLIRRPVSSVLRLVFVVSDGVRDTFDPEWMLGLEDDEVKPLTHAPFMDSAEWEAEIDEMVGRRASHGTVEYLIGGEQFFPRLEQAIREARESILVRTYIFDNDDYALRIADLLRERSKEGVEVLVLMDGLGTLGASTQPPDGLPAGHDAPASIGSYLEDGTDITVRRVLNPFFTGDHTKTIVIDQEIAFLGGMNIGREYRYEWHDLMAEVRGPVVAKIADDFDIAFAGAGFWGDLGAFLQRIAPNRDPGPKTGYPVRLLFTRPTSSEIRRVQLAAIERAQNRIYLQNAYFTDDTFLHELVRARRRGVDVRVIIPLRSDRGILARDNVLAANVMYRNGIRVHIFPGMSHVKAAVYDGWICMGSANVDQLSLRVNREANIATSAPEAVESLVRDVFEADFRASPEMRREFPTYWHDLLWEMVGDYVF
jgi:cardiolipin synthase